MPTTSLTSAAVERIKPPATGQTDHFDRGFPGLCLRVSHGGAKAWSYVFRAHGKVRRITLGRWPAMSLGEARDAWREARKAVDRGENPARQKPADADSFESVMAEWLKRDQAENRCTAEVERALRRDVLPAFEGRSITTIGRRDVLDVLDAIVDRGAPIMARRTAAHLHRFFRWAVGRGVIEASPMADLPKPAAPKARERVLSDAELAAVWEAAERVGWPFGPVVKLLILTGARRNEIAALRWSEIHGDRIELAGERMKAGEAHMIPLSSAAVTIIEGLSRIAKCDFVFTTTGQTHVSGWSRSKELLDRAAAEIAGQPLPEWRLHDIRRTVATGLQRLGMRLEAIEAVLGHTGGSRAGIVGVYQRHSFTDEKRTALDAWARHVEMIISPPDENNIVPLRGRS
jgi:integrase